MYKFQVGSIVRIPCHGSTSTNADVNANANANAENTNTTVQKVFLRRALIATFDEDSGRCYKYGLFLEGAKPERGRKYLVTPPCITTPNESEYTYTHTIIQSDDETDEDIHDPDNDNYRTRTRTRMQLVDEDELKFYERSKDEQCTLSTEDLKAKGDSLLVLKDPASALEYYEEALKRLSKVQIGGYVVYHNKGDRGNAIIAEVDCMDTSTCTGTGNEDEDDNYIIDVTVLESGKEEILSAKDVMMGIHSQHENIALQTKILLNMTRCFLFMADIESYYESNNNASISGRTSQIQAYRKAGVKSSTLSLYCCSLIEENDEMNKTKLESKIRYIRAKVYCDVGKFEHARNDLRWILKNDQKNKAALSLLEELKHNMKQKKRTDRTLAKSMCRWIDQVTNNENECNDQDQGHVEGENQCIRTSDSNSISIESEQKQLIIQQRPNIILMYLCSLIILVISMFIGQSK